MKINGNVLQYIPHAEFAGNDKINYTLSDGVNEEKQETTVLVLSKTCADVTVYQGTVAQLEVTEASHLVDDGACQSMLMRVMES